MLNGLRRRLTPQELLPLLPARVTSDWDQKEMGSVATVVHAGASVVYSTLCLRAVHIPLRYTAFHIWGPCVSVLSFRFLFLFFVLSLASVPVFMFMLSVFTI